MNLPMEVVQERRDLPALGIFGELMRIGIHADFNRQHVTPQTIALHEFADDVPGLIPGHWNVY